MKPWWIPLAIAGVLIPCSAWAEALSVAVPTANFREGPSTKHGVLYTADRFYTVEVLERKEDWVKTRDFEGDVAWISEKLLEKRRAGVIKVPCAIVREMPDKDSAVAFKLDRGEGIEIKGNEGAWLNVVDAEGHKGWLHRDVVWGLDL